MNANFDQLHHITVID